MLLPYFSFKQMPRFVLPIRSWLLAHFETKILIFIVKYGRIHPPGMYQQIALSMVLHDAFGFVCRQVPFDC